MLCCSRSVDVVEKSVDELALALQQVQCRLQIGFNNYHQKLEAPNSNGNLRTHPHESEKTGLLLERQRLLAILYRRVNPDLKRFLQSQSWKFSGIQSVEDLCNETWSLLLGRLVAFDPAQASFTTWFYVYVVRLVLNRERRYKMRRDQFCVETAPEDFAELQTGEIDEWTSDCLQEIRQATAHLAPRWKAIIDGLYLSDPPKKQTDLARELGISTAAVNQNKSRALAYLRTLLEARGYC